MAVILVVDDEATTREVVRDILALDGHVVVEAANGGQAIGSLESGAIELIITDLLMPEQDGLEFLLWLRTHRPHLPVIAMSGGGRVPWRDLLEIARSFGARETLAKPFDADDLRARVRSLLPQPANGTG